MGVLEPPVLSASRWKTNGALIAGIAKVGWLQDQWTVVDPTYGEGAFWTQWKPAKLLASDLNVNKSPTGLSLDATKMPLDDNSVDAATIDAPYQLRGTTSSDMDERYGVEEYETVEFRHGLMKAMLKDAARYVRPGGTILFKCQAQVCSGRYWNQPHIMVEYGESRLGLEQVDEFLFLAHRGQPERSRCGGCGAALMLRSSGDLKGCWATMTRSTPPTSTCPDGTPHSPTVTTQEHSHRNYSAMLVFQVTK